MIAQVLHLVANFTNKFSKEYDSIPLVFQRFKGTDFVSLTEQGDVKFVAISISGQTT